MLSFCDTFTDDRKQELAEHGTMEFPIACYFDNLKQKSNPWYWHEEFEIGIVRENAAIVRTPDGQRRLGKGDCFFINSGILHTIQNIDPEEGIVDSLVFHGGLPGGTMDSIFYKKYILPVQLNPGLSVIYFDRDRNKSAVNLIASAWMECVRNNDGFEIQVRFLLSRLFLLISQENAETESGKQGSVRMERTKAMLEYIKQHFAEDITLWDIADSASVSRSECVRCFRQVLKSSPVAYLNNYRLQHAAGLLCSTSWKISYICQKSGFHETAYFSKCFKKRYGCGPSAYRLSMTGKDGLSFQESPEPEKM